MPELMNEQQVRQDITQLKNFWQQRNLKFRDWFSLLLMIDTLAARDMESYASNEPATFYDMSHYLLTRGELSHSISIEGESALELDKRARVDRGCQYMWNQIDRERQLGGSMAYVDELGFFLLVLGWYSTVLAFDSNTGLMQSQIWNPFDTYPRYGNNRLVSCVHSYKITETEARLKAEENRWTYTGAGTVPGATGEVILDDYFYIVDGVPHNMIFIADRPVTEWIARPEMKLLVSPVGGYPDKGSLNFGQLGKRDWKRLAGRGIFEVNESVSLAMNKWKSMISQILRDTAQPVTQEFSATPQATPEQLRERGVLFHYGPGEAGLQRLPPAAIPIEIQAHLFEIRRELQKGSFNDAVFGMTEGRYPPGYALSLMASSSANQILYAYMDAKHFVVSEADRFWLSNLKSSNRTFDIKGKFLEKLKPTDIPKDVSVIVESDVATPKDWLERGTIANQLENHLDRSTILRDVLKQTDPQAIIRRRSLDRMMEHPVSQLVEMIAGYYVHADYLESRGDRRQAALFRRAAQSLEGQLGVPPPGQGMPAGASEVEAAREAGAPGEKVRISPDIAPPETGGFTPAQLRRIVGKGSISK